MDSSNAKISWGDSEENQVIENARSIVKGGFQGSMPVLIKQAQEILPANRRRSEKGVHHYVTRNMSILDKQINSVDVTQSASNAETISDGTEVSAMASSSGAQVSVNPSEAPAISRIRPYTRIKWTKATQKKIVSAILDKYPEDQWFTKSLGTMMFNCQDVLEEDLRKKIQAVHSFVFTNKEAIKEMMRTEIYRRKQRQEKEAKELAETNAAESSEVSAVAIPSDVTQELFKHLGSPQTVEEFNQAIAMSAGRISTALFAVMQPMIVNRMQAMMVTVAESMMPGMEASVMAGFSTAMHNVETRLLQSAKNREVVRIKALVVGPQSDQQSAISRAMDNIFELRYVSSSENPRNVKNHLAFAQHVILMTDKLSHTHKDLTREHPHVHFVTGGSSAIVSKLEEIYANT